MRAFEAAVALGYEYLETDVQATADGVLIALHDDRLDRVTDHAGPVAAMTWAQLRPVRIAGTEPVLRFDELLEAMPDIRINVDAKDDAAVGALIQTVRRAGALDRMCFGALSDRRVARIRRAFGARACTVFGTREVAALRLLAWGRAALPGDPPASAWPVRAGSHPVARGVTRRSGLRGCGPRHRPASPRLDRERIR